MWWDLFRFQKRIRYNSSSYKLLYNPWIICITGLLWLWLKVYLTGHTHHVSVEECLSDPLSVHSGVPQGSVLGPLLLLIYINDLPNATCLTTILLFAAHNKLLHTISNSCCSTQLQQDLDAIGLWCSTWKLSLNTIKSAAMWFSFSNSSTFT